MNTAKEIVLNICVISIIVSVLRYMIPQGNFGKITGFVVSVYLVVMLISPMGEYFQIETYRAEEFIPHELSEKGAYQLEQATVKEVEATVALIASQENIPVTIQSLETSVKDYRVFIDRISLSVQGTLSEKNKIKSRVQSVIQTMVEVVN
ncbi:MAG: hypothetical protein IKT68_02455 [Clostridia bacterium]|nr:hypothetical protein [Clostridia bacterium]